MSSERIKEIIEKMNTAQVAELIGVAESDLNDAIKSAKNAVDREQKILDRIVVLRYKENPTEKEKIEHNALEALIFEGDLNS